ncbi:sulfite oxidase-like isoform X1 [Harmonia axyridis]|uniref:sulfite oxidase-like isoform X1 n=2 Tax=Harmonia axyridis TaxID=115357 RepID=UPI001E275777|nr:sulfite oxidase-like isoform X1 [Harmonia axyridis]
MFSRNFKNLINEMCYWFTPKSSYYKSKGCCTIIRQNIVNQRISQYDLANNNIHILAAAVGWLSYSVYEKRYLVHAEAADKQLNKNQPKIPPKPDLPIYSSEEVSKHVNNETRIWVTFQHGVYDITDFVHEHPGGDQILMAAGNAVDPFWMLYSIHLNPHVLNILEKYRIGNLDPKDNNDVVSDMSDPFANEPTRHPLLKPASEKPFNAEAPEYILVENFLTPNDIFYVRNHLPVPDIQVDTYALEVEIEGKSKILTLSLDDLKKFPKHSVTSTVMCAGNRRSEMHKVKPVKGLNWGAAALGNATWTGASLREVLEAAGLSENEIDKYQHIQFEAYDTDTTGSPYGASIPIWKGVDRRGDVILAYEMNGETLPRDHGFPVRAVVPGVVGARNVKWLAKIIVASEESQSHWQQKDYKGFSPSTDWDTVDYSKSPSIQELPVTSAICQPMNNATVDVKDGKITAKGYAWSGGGQEIVRVDVSCDGGKTWHVAKFDFHDANKSPQHWSWTLWSCDLPVPKGTNKMEIIVKAVDSSYNTQPELFENIWNLRGVLNNAYHRIKVNLK